MKLHAQRGNAILELALVLPFMILITLGVTELGRYAYFSIAVANAAKAGVAYGAQNNRSFVDDNGMIAAAQNDYASNGLGTLTGPAPTATQYCANWNFTNQTLSAPTPCAAATSSASSQPVLYVSVTAQATMVPLFHYPLLPGAITVTSTATQQAKQGP